MSFHKKIVSHSKKFINEIKAKEKKTPSVHQKKISVPQFSPSAEHRIRADISLLSAIKIIAVVFIILLAGKAINQIGDILITLFFSLFIALILFPGVKFLESKKIPRPFAILIIYTAVIGVVTFLLLTLFPAILKQLTEMGEWAYSYLLSIKNGDFHRLPEFLQEYGTEIQAKIIELDNGVISVFSTPEGQQGIIEFLKQNSQNIKNFGEDIVEIFFQFLSGLLKFLLIMVMAFFILLDAEKIRKFFLSFFPKHSQEYVEHKGGQIQTKLSAWIHSQMILFVVMGGLTWIGLSLLGVEYALTLGFLAGIAEFIPFLGPILAFAAAAPFAFQEGIEVGIAVIILFACLQFFEGNILIPRIMDKELGVLPIVTIVAMMIGFEFLGVWGAMLSIPVAAILYIFIQDLIKKEHEVFDENDKEKSSKEKKT